MSKRKRKPPKKKQPSQQTLPSPPSTDATVSKVVHVPTTSAAATPQKSSSFTWQTVITTISVLVAIGSLWFAWGQKDINQKNQDRAAGKVKAKFTLEDVSRTHPRLTKKTDQGEFVHLDNFSDMVEWGPHITIRNTGEEIIDSIKVEVFCYQGAAVGPGVKQIYPKPFFINEPTTREVSNFGKFAPGEKASIYLMPMLLDQMMQAKYQVYTDTDRIDLFQIRVYCRIIGGTAYDISEPDRATVMCYRWGQKGFKEEEKYKDIIKHTLAVKVEN